jgi:anti-sigma factor RsiW
MKECCTENALALYVESDLPAREMERIRLHLEQCPTCQAVVSELCETQSELKALRQDMAPASAHASVREHVMKQIAHTSALGWSVRLERMLCGIRWRYAVSCVALLGIVGAILWQLHPFEQPERVAVVNPSSPRAGVSQRERTSVNAPSIPAPTKVVRKLRKQAAAQPKIPLATQPERVVPDEKNTDSPRPVMVKLMTDDPGVVIYWIVDQNGGSE